MPTITIIVPVYRVAPYLKRCVDSILNQTYKNLEIILVDDGSPDNCGKICDNYSQIDNRINVIHKQNGGLSSARNAGLDIATGDFIGFVDSDDWIHPQMYEILLTILENTNADFVNCRYEQINEYTQPNQYFDIPHIAKQAEIFTKEEILNDFHGKFYHKIWMTVWSKLYKKHIFDSLRFKEGVICEDDIIMLPTINRASTVAVLEEQLYYYFMSPNSVMRSTFSNKNYKILDIFYDRYKWFEKNSLQYNLWQLEFCYKYLSFLIFTKKYYPLGKIKIKNIENF